MWSDSISVPLERDQELFLEVLRSLPVPVERSGELELIAGGITPSYTVSSIETLRKFEIIPGLKIKFGYNGHHKVFVAGAELEQRLQYNEYLRSPQELKTITAAVLAGKRPHIYQIEMDGFGTQFTYQQLEEQFFTPLFALEYPITRGKLTLGTSMGYDKDAWTVHTELFLQRGSVTLSDNYVKPARLADWFATLKEKYTPKEK